jgi:hypothetical protein
MARRPYYREDDESLSREQLNELKRNPSLLSTPGVENFYRTAYKDCAPERKPGARAIQ